MPPTALVTDTEAVRTPSAIVKLVPKRAFVRLGPLTALGGKKNTHINIGHWSDFGGLMSSRLFFPAIIESWVGVLSKNFGG